ncbi:MAG: hypothetical protein E5V34_08580 [Mesorhizobium sp.]|nr:MAG: hypothetical protein E5V34_08580 [Mesorhizobium sp.]
MQVLKADQDGLTRRQPEKLFEQRHHRTLLDRFGRLVERPIAVFERDRKQVCEQRRHTRDVLGPLREEMLKLG